jgi:hypothetical protein
MSGPLGLPTNLEIARCDTCEFKHESDEKRRLADKACFLLSNLGYLMGQESS